MIDMFPHEISTEILKLLNLSSLRNVLQVSKRWNRDCRSDIIWKSKIVESGYPVKLEKLKQLGGYFELFKHYMVRDIRWKFMSSEFVAHFKVHTGKIIALVMRGDYIVSASEDRTCCIWQVSKNRTIFQTRPDNAEPVDSLNLEIPVASCLDFCPQKRIQN